MDTTVTLAVAVKERLHGIQVQLRQDYGRAVTYNETVEYLLDARDELARLLADQYGGGT